MMFRLFLALGAASLFMMGCKPRAVVGPTVSLQSGARVVSPDNHEGGEIWVWLTKDEGEERQTRAFRLSAEGPLQVLGQQDGIVIATSRGDLTWQAREKEVGLVGCPDVFSGPPGSLKGSVTMVNLVDSNGNVVQKVVDASNSEGSELQDLQHHVRLLGSIGPYLFIHEESWMNNCGLHGHEMASAMVWDAESGKTVDIWTEVPNQDKLSDMVRRKLDEAQPVDPGQEETSKPEPAQLLPVYGDRGALRIDAQFAQWACYSCSDHEWSSYTRSAVVPTDWIPERMKAWAMPPVVVKELLESRKDWRLGGWSKR